MANKRIKFDRILCFDGAMGTMLQRRGLKAGEYPEVYNMVYPDAVGEVHREYVLAGADIITTNTFGANHLKLKNTGYTVEQVIGRAVGIAREAAGERLVALDIGPTGQLMYPAGTLDFEEAYQIFKRQVVAGAASGADLVLIETMSDLYEAKAAILAVKENCNLPVFCTMTFQEDGRTLTGTDPLTMVNVLEGLGVDALGINCSLGPKEMIPIVEEILRYAAVPVMVQPNAGLPSACGDDTVYSVTPEEFAGYMADLADRGVVIFGGCCGTDPDFIKVMKRVLEGKRPLRPANGKVTAVSSWSRTVLLGSGVKVIGERINPTGKKRLKEALKNNDMDYVLQQAVGQRDAGADILDVNVGLSDIDERETMKRVIREVQGIIDLPLQIDSGRADVIEEGVRIYNGKPLINSVNGKKEVMEAIFPIVKKYGACVVGLTLDERGIPGTAEERVRIAGDIIEAAGSYGIPPEDILIDCLVLTASAQQEQVMETLKAVRMVKEKYGVCTVLGVSNVSFGLPRRALLNRTFLAMALAQGLDAPIVDPAAEGIMDTVNCYRVLAGQDRESKDYIRIYGGATPDRVEVPHNRQNRDLKQSIIDGIKKEAVLKASELLQRVKPMDIVDNYLIPALDEVGGRYERGELFLPQLLQSAEAVKAVFDVLKGHMVDIGQMPVSRGKVLLATVKGDIHDIGKNIVKVLLENYGFQVVDLGRDVPVRDIVDTVKKEGIRLVGLSALMTTTVKSMEDTIKALRESGSPCKVMVGGAVLNEEYAVSIGADYYARNAQEGVNIAREVFQGQ